MNQNELGLMLNDRNTPAKLIGNFSVGYPEWRWALQSEIRSQNVRKFNFTRKASMKRLRQCHDFLIKNCANYRCGHLRIESPQRPQQCSIKWRFNILKIQIWRLMKIQICKAGTSITAPSDVWLALFEVRREEKMKHLRKEHYATISYS